MMLTHYALLPPDPTTQAHLSVVTAGDEGALALEVAGQSVVGEKLQIPLTAEHIYHFRVSGLRPGALHPWQIPGAGTGLPLRTLPGAMPPQGLRILETSDVHIELTGSDTTIAFAASFNPDLAILIGDQVSRGRVRISDPERDGESPSRWLHGMNMHQSLSTTFLVPILMLPGNHDVGGESGDKWSASDNFYRFFCPSISDTAPIGENYGKHMFGDYLETWSLDAFSETPALLGQWLATLTPEANTVVWLGHQPLFADSSRSGRDVARQAELRDFCGRKLLENCLLGFCGHMHQRAVTKGLAYYDSDPGGDRFELSGGGFIGLAENGHVQLGNGYPAGRPGSTTEWFHEFNANDYTVDNHIQIIDLDAQSIRVRSINHLSTVVYDRTWQRPRPRRSQPVGADGRLVTAIGANGAPSYPVRAS